MVWIMLFCLPSFAGCQTATTPVDDVLLRPEAPPAPAISQHDQRVAVFYSFAYERDIASGYEKLEQAVLQVKRQRPWLRVLDRRHLASVMTEQRLQLSARFSDDAAVHMGRLLGADSIVGFRLDVPSWRERLLPRMHGTIRQS